MHARGRGLGLLGALTGAALLATLLGGCATGAKASRAYADGRYETALIESRRDARRMHGAKRDRAKLTAGLSAHALGNYDEAEDWLEPLVSNDDPEIAGRASAALGLIDRDLGRLTEARAHFTDAAGDLNGLDGDRAAAAAGELRRSSGTATSLDSARVRRSMSSAHGAYTVQIGAFSRRRNAEQAASDVRRRALGAGLGEPRITPIADRTGSLLYLVQVGAFADRHQAEVAVRSLGGGMVTMARAN